MGGGYEQVLDFVDGVVLLVEFETEGPEVVDYAVVLLIKLVNGARTVRVYDGAHGFNEVHHYTRAGGKQAGREFHAGTLGEGMRAAINEVSTHYPQMIEGWDHEQL